MAHDAMTQEELDSWTEDVFKQVGSRPVAKPQTFWIIVFILLGILMAMIFVGILYWIMRKCVDEDLGGSSEDIRLQFIANDKEGGMSSPLLNDMSGRCAVCHNISKAGKNWRSSGFGGCGYLVCKECYANYKPLEERCVVCGQFYCYRRGRVTFEELERQEDTVGDGDDPDETPSGLRRRASVATST